MSETRKIAAILVADVVGYSRLTGANEDRTLSPADRRHAARPGPAVSRSGWMKAWRMAAATTVS